MQNQTPSSLKPQTVKRMKQSIVKYRGWNDTLRVSNQKLQNTAHALEHKCQALESRIAELEARIESQRDRADEDLKRAVGHMENQLNSQLVIRADLEGQIRAYEKMIDKLLADVKSPEGGGNEKKG